MTHYFENDPRLKHNRKQLVFRFLGVDYKLMSDAGVFSKDHVDLGTQTMLTYLINHPTSGSFLDLGCGYGVVAIVVKKNFPETEVIASDVNQRALSLTIENAQLNDVNITSVLSDGFENIHQMFNSIAFNPPIKVGKKKMYALLLEARDHLTTDGVLTLVIRKDQGAKSALNYVQSIFHSCHVSVKHKGFWVITCIKSA